jgi:hypothetical protein
LRAEHDREQHRRIATARAREVDEEDGPFMMRSF